MLPSESRRTHVGQLGPAVQDDGRLKAEDGAVLQQAPLMGPHGVVGPLLQLVRLVSLCPRKVLKPHLQNTQRCCCWNQAAIDETDTFGIC